MFLVAVESEDIVRNLFPNLPVFIAHLLASIVLLLIMWRWVYLPFRKSLHDRHVVIKEKIDDAALKEITANQKALEAQQTLDKVQNDVTVILEQARAESEALRKEMLEQAKIEVTRIQDKMKYDNLLLQEKMRQELNHEIKLNAILIADKILQAEIDDTKHQELINSFIAEL